MIQLWHFSIPWWTALLAIGIGWAALAFVRHVSRPVDASVRRQTEMSKAHQRQPCDTCHGEGVYDITDPSKHLLLADQMSNINQTTCACCTGNGFHMVAQGEHWNCQRLVARRLGGL